MYRIDYIPKKVLVKPIERPEKIDLFNHLIIFINDKDSTIETAVPDFEERYFDSNSSNIHKIDENTEMTFFEIVKENNHLNMEPIYELTIFGGTEKDSMKYTGPKVISSRCVNGYSASLEDVITNTIPRVMVKK